MADKLSLSRRWENWQASKTQVFWSCAACIVATLILGFSWGGWVTGGTAKDMVSKAASGARAELAADVCVHQFVSGADASVKLASLKQVESWKRDDFIEKGGWVTMPGVELPVTGAASICAKLLMDAKTPVLKAIPPG